MRLGKILHLLRISLLLHTTYTRGLYEMLILYNNRLLANNLHIVTGIKLKYMLQNATRSKKLVVIAVCSFLLLSSLGSFAQKSVYDVIPGSGPKKKPSSSAPGVIRGTDRKNDGVYTGRRSRRSLPPGQAKKIYGGSARDYAPGQEKRRKHHKKHHGHRHHHERED